MATAVMDEEDELVSVVVPAYNAAATIGETLESTLAQTYPRLEVLVVDDGSTDATAEVVGAFAARDPRVRLIQQANAGVAVARNLAIAHARGVYIAPLDADDLWHPEKIALQVAALRRAGPRVGVVYCWWRIIDPDGRVIAADWLPYPHEGDVYAALIMGNPLPSASLPLIRRTCLAEVGGYDPGLRTQGAQGCEDLKLYLRLAERYDFGLVRRYLVAYRRAPGSMGSDPRRMLRSQQIVVEEARHRRPDLPGWLFRLGRARYAYLRGKECLRHGRLFLGHALLLGALRRDPAAVFYRLAEGPYRRLSRYLRPRLTPRPPTQAARGGVRPKVWLAARIIGYCAEVRRTDGNALPRRRIDVGGQPFLALAPEPDPEARSCSSLYAWRCEVLAAGLARRRWARPATEAGPELGSVGGKGGAHLRCRQ